MVTAQIRNFLNTAKSIATSLANLFTGKTTFKQAGMDIINALWEGIKAQWVTVGDGIKGLLTDAFGDNQITRFLGISGGDQGTPQAVTDNVVAGVQATATGDVALQQAATPQVNVNVPEQQQQQQNLNVNNTIRIGASSLTNELARNLSGS